jgi:predicted small metal-binding protein
MDGDAKGKKDTDTGEARYEKYFKQLGETRLHALICKEIENLLPQAIVHAMVKKKCNNIQQDKIDEIKYAKYSKLKSGLGKYLDATLGLENVFKDKKTDTIKYKVDFCKDAITFMRDETVAWELTNETRAICKKIFDHIEMQNK